MAVAVGVPGLLFIETVASFLAHHLALLPLGATPPPRVCLLVGEQDGGGRTPPLPAGPGPAAGPELSERIAGGISISPNEMGTVAWGAHPQTPIPFACRILFDLRQEMDFGAGQGEGRPGAPL